ncbi:MAG TPA: RNA polymerase sigma factor [Propionibacteriaceae bacterium]|nr:RNA polymerase sigma factor [Propionibacteriaceae bacterium]
MVAEHGATVLRVCRALLGPTEAEDAWAETFLAALLAYPRLPDDANLRAWLVTIASRKAIDQHRQRQRTPLPMAEVPEQGLGQPDERDDALWWALDALPPTQRAAVAYHHVGGLPYAEVARLLGNSEAAARRAAADGIKRLREWGVGAADE